MLKTIEKIIDNVISNFMNYILINISYEQFIT